MTDFFEAEAREPGAEDKLILRELRESFAKIEALQLLNGLRDGPFGDMDVAIVAQALRRAEARAWREAADFLHERPLELRDAIIDGMLKRADALEKAGGER